MSDNILDLDGRLLAKKIREARKSLNLSQHDLAESIGISDKTISSYEVGRAVPPVNILKHISVITNRNINFFFETKHENDLISEKVDKLISELQLIKKILE